VIEFNDMDHGYAIAARLNRSFDPEMDQVISHVGSDGKLLGGVIYEGYNGVSVSAHQVGFDKHWISRDMLWVMFHYPFCQLKCRKIIGTVESSDADILAFNKKLGFIVEAVVKDAAPSGDLLVMTMTPEQCPWLKLKPRGIR